MGEIVAPAAVTKPELSQVTNYVGAAALGAAAWIVSHQDLVTAFVPSPWNHVAAAGITLIGAGLIAYREKHTVPATGVV